MISPSCPFKIILCSVLAVAGSLGAMAADYGVNTATSGDKYWSLPATWTGGTPAEVPNSASDKVTYGFNADGNISLYVDLAEVEVAELLVTGDTPRNRGIYGHGDLASTLKIGKLTHTAVGGTLALRNSSNDARLSLEINTLEIGSGAILEVGNINSSAGLSLESFEVKQSSTIEGIVRFNNIKERVAEQNILDLGALNLSGQIVIGGRGNTGGILRVSSLSGTTGRVYVFRDNSTHNGMSGTLEINSTQPGSTSYSGVIREHFSDTIQAGAPAGVSLDVKKLGEGTQIFNRAAGQLYSGGTAIEGGVLAVDNTSGSGLGFGEVTVSGTGTLAGKGRLELKEAAIEVKAGGTLAPSAHLDTGIATLTISGAQTPTGVLLSLEEGATLSFRLGAGNTSDRIAFTGWHAGGLDLADQGVIINASSITAGRFNLFSFDTIDVGELISLTAGFNAQTLGSGFDGWQGIFGYGTQGGENVIWLEVSVIPEPGSIALAVLGLGALGWSMRCRGRKKA